MTAGSDATPVLQALSFITVITLAPDAKKIMNTGHFPKSQSIFICKGSTLQYFPLRPIFQYSAQSYPPTVLDQFSNTRTTHKRKWMFKIKLKLSFLYII